MRAKYRSLFWLTHFYRNKTGRPFDELDVSKLPKFKRILVLSTTAMGDTLLSTPAITALREGYPSAKIKVMVRDRYCGLLKDNPDIDGIIPFRKGLRGFYKTWKEVKKEKFEIVFDLHISDPRPVAISVFSGVSFIVGKALQPQFDAFYSKVVRPDPTQHAIDRRLDVIRSVRPLEDNRYCRMVLPLDRSKTEDVWKQLSRKIQLANGKPIIVGFQPGANADFRKWPQDHFIALGKKLLSEVDQLKILILGSPNETHLGKAIEAGIGQKTRVFSLCGKTSLTDLPHVVKGLDCLVTNDTGTMHVAIAVGTRTVCLFVPSQANGPHQDLEIHRVITKERPCGDDCLMKKCKSPWCMGLISPDEVFDAVMDIFSQGLIPEKVG